MANTTQGGINLLIWTVVFTILDGLFVFLRFWAARLIHRPIYADDYFIVVALIIAFILEGILLWSVFNGMGKHAFEMTPEEFVIIYKIIPATYVTYTVGTATFKLSVLSLYVRIFSVQKTFKRLSYTVMALTVAYCVTFLAVFLTTCSPDISQLWNPRPDGYCRDLNIGQLGSVSVNLAVDVIIIVLPMPFLWRLNMSLRNKIFVTITFSLSFMTIGIMIWRIVDLTTSATADMFSNMPTLALTTTLELWMCIIIACIPTLAPLFKTYLVPLISKFSRLGSSDGSGSVKKALSIVTFGRLGMAPSLGPVLVTGGCGFIGFHLVKGLLALERQIDIHVIDIDIARNTHHGVTYHKCDITSAADVEAVFLEARPRTIFHIACPDSMVHQPDVFRRVNVDGAKNLLLSARRLGTVQALVNTSTSSVIHDNVSDLIDADDTSPVLKYPAQKRVYTLTKAEAEAELIAANRSDGDSSMLVVSLRPATAFGERDTICMGKIVATCRAGKGNIQIGPGKNEYDFMYVSNLVDAHIIAAQALLDAYGKPPPPEKNRVDGQCFNVTNDERILFWDFQRAVSASIGLPVRPEDIKIVPAWVALLGASVIEWVTWLRTLGKGRPPLTWETVRLTIITRTLNGDRFKRITGYKPRVSIREGLAIAGKWFVEEQRKAQDLKKTISMYRPAGLGVGQK
ncbi:hypothetical protein VPNG_08074 [Cytospora leucostoma]|uniref:Uncharacterized protein n=1 Tax=Cytospora leucostoma TaxID=1230097 RepID=A0A423WS09_9PEZI|nr:hypothetical protein VPNG_08074 [Cytospora leucostoma]